jgi:DNA invertase Pin-like site-specific DNA recombinase
MIVAIYARVSTTKQAKKDLSIPDQLHQMREWCKTQKINIAVEYIEAGASATDDKRPIFQQMISESCVSPPPFEAIIVHSLSRFFRNSLEFGLYERKLNRCGIKIISITQQTSDDPSGEMARKIFSIFDEYQSKENAKHTLRAMKENARQGYFNGSNPPYGFRTIEVPQISNKGRKKRLEIDSVEAAIIKKIFNIYLHGIDGKSFGIKGIVSYLNSRGTTKRGRKWSTSTIHGLLKNRTYIGEYFFNKKVSKTGKIKPKSEWIKIEIKPISNYSA